MRRIFVSVMLAAASASAALAGGCSGGKNGGGADAAADSYGVHVTGDGASDDGGGDGGEEPDSPTVGQATMRLAQASPDVGPVDFCWRQTGAASFTGPVLEGDLPPEAGPPATDGTPGDAADGSSEDAPEGATPMTPDAGKSGGLAFGAMSPDVLLPSAGTFDIAVVAAGQTSCEAPRLAGTVTLDAGKRVTVVLMGLASEDSGPDALGVVAFTDAPIDPTTARVRMIHAALGDANEPATGALSVKAGDTVLAAQLDPRMTSAPSMTPTIDALGYATLPPLQIPTPFVLETVGDAAAAEWATMVTDLTVQAGTSHTGIILTLGQGTLGITWCGDAPTVVGGPAMCTLLPAQP